MTTEATHYLTTHGLKFARNLTAFTDCLFRPYEGGTCDGYIDRVLKSNQVRLFFRGETYVLNQENVFCLATKMENGKTWYSYGGKLNTLTLSERDDLACSIREMMNVPRF
jgi:hypothetical protein